MEILCQYQRDNNCVFFGYGCLNIFCGSAGTQKTNAKYCNDDGSDHVFTIVGAGTPMTLFTVTLLFTGVTKPTFIPVRDLKFPYFYPGSFFHSMNDHLCNTITRVYDLFFLRKVD